ncbi:FAD:protein FMN transferase [Cryobacterium sp. PH31-O1]|uniref:FAD:protein FMN transferase n=1 Tax=Cryobacterium sp. PH31-O1 TaxID=3046306 RepID=UPI0024BA7C0D|nr:FAD:protein FMN transferase [Cryobacterium sp. PH31-O1]MDJ0337683.1 FAD:protein FMN transferase [Cryobacterium sp. PH31-O1]
MPALTFATMGTMVSLRLGDAEHGATALTAAAQQVETVFRRWDEQFSLYREDSELSRVARGDIRLTAASESLRDCYALALDWRDRTQGVFTPHRGDGVIDLSGVVKALAIAEAGIALTDRGLRNWSINAGGDVLVCGDALGHDWVVAIVDPADRGESIASVPLRHPLRAVATSGSAERGQHIWTPRNFEPSPFRQVSVFAADIVTADVLATAIVAGGEAALGDLAERFPIDVLAVLRDGQLLATPGLRKPLSRTTTAIDRFSSASSSARADAPARPAACERRASR